MNTQPIEKLSTKPGTTLEVVDLFLTIQGEGPYTGHRSVFIRLAGCNLQCPGCDTDYTSNRRSLHVGDIVESVIDLAKPPYLVVITGGEPFRQNITILANALLAIGYTVQVETNGTLPPSEGLRNDVMIVCSPKAGKLNYAIAQRVDCFKYVMHADSVDETDGLPVLALDHSARPRVARPPEGFKGAIFLQPMDCKDYDQNQRNIQAVVQSCMKHGYLLQLQVHKIVGVE